MVGFADSEIGKEKDLEQGSERSAVNTQAGTRGKQKSVLPIIVAFVIGLGLVWLARGLPEQYKPKFDWHIILAICLAVMFILRMLPTFFDWTVGTIGLVQIFSPEFEQRARKRYQAEMALLTDLGFDLAFFVGDSTSVFRMLLIFPAIVVFDMWRNGVPMTVQNGTRLLTGNPVFISRDKSAYAHPNSFGFTFHTGFQDGTALVSKNFGDDTGYISSIVGNTCPAASAADTWAAHQKRLEELVAEGRRVDRQTSFQAYREIVLKEQMGR
jgi:hypothetical protein